MLVTGEVEPARRSCCVNHASTRGARPFRLCFQ
jgi:hypothetical protein